MRRDQTHEQVAEERGLTVGQVRQLQTQRGLSLPAVRALPDAALRRAMRRLEYADLPRVREAFRLLQAEDERGVVPHHALAEALARLDGARMRAMVRARRRRRSRVAGIPTGERVTPGALAAAPRTAGLSPTQTGWRSLGPGNIGGRTRSIVIHPTTPDTMWAGSVGGGVWRTSDGGASWQPVDDQMANLAVSCMVMDPSHPQILYAGTGEGFSNLDSIRGAGIFRTLDGTNWAQLAATTGPNFQAVNRLAISSTGKVVLVATPKGIFRSNDPACQTWSQPLTDPVACVHCHPTDSTQALAGGLFNGQAYFSTDGGQTWNIAAHPGVWSGRVEVMFAAQNAAVVYASIANNSGEIWRSTDGGKTYTKRNSLTVGESPAFYLGDQGWYGNVIWAGDPTNADFVIVGGVDLWKSTDGGNTLVEISTWWDPASAHADHHCIVSHPGFNGTTNRMVFFGNDGGLYKTLDVSTVGNNPNPPHVNGWMPLDHSYAATQFYFGAGHPETGTIIGGAQDNGTLRYTTDGGTEQWTSMFGGDGGWCAADPTDSNVFYGEYVFLNIHRSTDGGATSDYISGQYWNGTDWVWKPVPYRIPDAKNSQALFVAPFVLDPNEPNRILAGGVSLWSTNDAKTPNTPSTGPSWASIKGSVGPPISVIAVAHGNSDLIWVGHTDGQLYQTANGTSATPIWQRIDQTGSSPLAVNRYCARITIDPKDTRIVYVTFGGYTKGNVWKTTDGGGTWCNLGSALPEAPIRSLTIHPRRSTFLYLGTEVGVFASEDAGATWSPTNEGPTNCSVDDMFWMHETLVCVTHGRGMFTIDLSGV